MGERYLYQKCPFLKEVGQERREQFETYFRTAPDWLIDAFVVEKMKKWYKCPNCGKKIIKYMGNMRCVDNLKMTLS